VGPAGADGADGIQGPPGVPGPAGQKGANWQGPWQAGVSYAVDDIVTDNGSAFICIQATTGLEDPANPAYWSLLAARGDNGMDGAAGPQGPAGADGAAGPQGPQGDPGPQGPAGPAGLAGADGAVGPQGPAGADGAAGPQGAQGDPGPQGPAGQGGLFVTDGNGENMGALVESGMSGSFGSPDPDTLWLLSDQGYLFGIEVGTGDLLDHGSEVDYVGPDCSGQGYLRAGNTTVTAMSFRLGVVMNSASDVLYSPKGTALTAYSYESTLVSGVCSNVNGNVKSAQGYAVFINLPATTGVPDTVTYATPVGLSSH
jgi:hypothetical protein